MIPILFTANETEFTTQGLGALSDCISCTVTEERNGAFELEMQYPMTGLHFSEITDRCIVWAIPSPYRTPQPFRIYRVTKPINGVCTIYANHISYDLAGTPLNPFTVSNAPAAMAGLSANAETQSPFIFWTDKSTVATFTVTVPSATRSVLGGQSGSILDVYGGEYEWDKFTVKLHNQRGSDNGVTIRYGKNLTDIEQDRNIANVCTGIYPYWADTDGNLVTCSPKVINASGDFGFTRVVPVDFSSDFETAPTPEQLEQRTRQYIIANKIGVPTVSITASFIQLDQTEEYKHLALLQKCELCDTVTIQFEQLGIDTKAQIVKTETDVLNERYKSVEIGDARTNIADTIVHQQQEIAKAPTTSTVTQIANAITAAIIGAKGGCVRLLDTDGDGVPDTLYIADNADPLKAKKVWRFNKEGWGGSKNGYNGPFTVAASLENGMYADFLTAGTLNAAQVNVINLKADSITAGTLNCALLKVVNLISDHVKSTAYDGRYLMELWAAALNLSDNNNYRIRIYTTRGENSAGIIQVFSGKQDVSDDSKDETTRYSYLSPNGVGVGETQSGEYVGDVKCGNIFAGKSISANTVSVGSGENYFTASGNGVYMRSDKNGVKVGMYGTNLNKVYAEKLNIGGVERTFLTII